jgi:hypothetical protein
MTHDALDSAYATLGLQRGVSAVAVKRRYRALVRQWHPDQFANDPQGITDATLMLKAVNRAYKTIVEHRAPEAVDDASNRQYAASHQATRVGARLTRQQRDEIIDAIRHSESLLALTFDDGVAGWRSRVASIAVLSTIAAMGWKSGDPRIVIVSVLPLLCVWFPDQLGALGGDNITPSPAWIVWLLGWGILLVLALLAAFGRTP